MSRVGGISIFGPNGCHPYDAEKLSSGLGIVVPVLIIQVLHIPKRAHICCLHLAYFAPVLIIVGIASTIL